jgi:tripartite ATP-independent transporter DctM subunit
MPSAGLWMLATVALLMIATGLPTWIVLIGVSLLFSIVGIAGGLVDFALLTALPARLLGLLENDLLQALPLYVLIGALLNRLPLAELLFRVGSSAARRTGAGPSLAGLALGVLLAPMNGSVGASVAMLTRTLVPRLDASGIPTERGAALVCVASTLGVVVPPSLVLILLGDAMLRAHTEAVNATGRAARIINTQDVFRGALLPAAILLLLFVLVTWGESKTPAGREAQMSIPPVESGPSRLDWMTAMATLVIIVGLLASVTLGYLYAVEAAATGGTALFVAGLATRTLSYPKLKEVLRDTMAVTGALFSLLIGATTFTLTLRAFGTDRWAAAFLTGLGGGVYGALLVVLLLLALCAFVLDAFELIFVVIPVLIPPLLVRVSDTTWVAVLVLLILQASFLMPPFGYSVMMVRNRLDRPIETGKLVRALAPYLLAQLLVLCLVLAVPRLVWHEGSTQSSQGSPSKPLSDKELQELLWQQLGPGEPERAPEGK